MLVENRRHYMLFFLSIPLRDIFLHFQIVLYNIYPSPSSPTFAIHYFPLSSLTISLPSFPLISFILPPSLPSFQLFLPLKFPSFPPFPPSLVLHTFCNSFPPYTSLPSLSSTLAEPLPNNEAITNDTWFTSISY